MALSNIFREPRREIIETVVGIGIVGGVLFAAGWVIYRIALTIQTAHPDTDMSDAYFKAFGVLAIGLFAIVASGFVLLILTVLIHSAGEGVCNLLDKIGLQLRPQQRYGRRR